MGDPIASSTLVLVQVNYDRGVGPIGDGYKVTTNIQPVIPIKLDSQWYTTDTVLQVGLVGGFVTLNMTQAGLLLAPPFRRHALEEGGIDQAVELDDTHAVDASLQAIVSVG